MKNSFKELSETEMEIMEYFWKRGQGEALLTKDVRDYFATQGRDWKMNTVTTFLSRLVNKGMLKTEPKGKGFAFSVALTEEEYEYNKAKHLLDTQYDSSIKKFLVALSGGKELREEEIDELERWFRTSDNK